MTQSNISRRQFLKFGSITSSALLLAAYSGGGSERLGVSTVAAQNIFMAKEDPNMSIWGKRWAALKNSISNVQSQIDDTVSRHTTFATLLASLVEFGDRYQKVYDVPDFDAKFAHPANPLPESIHEYHKGYILRQFVDQATYDLSVIQRAYLQRKFGDAAEVAALEKAERWAMNALQPAIEANLIDRDSVTVVTYFQKSNTARFIPYAPVLFVGIPWSAVHNEVDFLTIPHEIGHFVYWFSRMADDSGQSHPLFTFARKLANMPIIGDPSGVVPFSNNSGEAIILQSWREELFADVYSALVGGPIMLKAMVDLMSEKLDLTEADGKHPAPLVRPYLYKHALDAIKDSPFRSEVNQLITDWESRIGGFPGGRLAVNHSSVFNVPNKMNHIVGGLKQLGSVQQLFDGGLTRWSENSTALSQTFKAAAARSRVPDISMRNGMLILDGKAWQPVGETSVADFERLVDAATSGTGLIPYLTTPNDKGDIRLGWAGGVLNYRWGIAGGDVDYMPC